MTLQSISQPVKASSEDLVFKSATELTKLLRSRTLSSVELVQEHLTQIKPRNPALNAIITLNAENALQQAAAADAA
ncbi:MAG: hypothetical protein AAGB19_21105, partial [Cyanobacteria bacterium P01_F01_bin.3]